MGGCGGLNNVVVVHMEHLDALELLGDVLTELLTLLPQTRVAAKPRIAT